MASYNQTEQDAIDDGAMIGRMLFHLPVAQIALFGEISENATTFSSFCAGLEKAVNGFLENGHSISAMRIVENYEFVGSALQAVASAFDSETDQELEVERLEELSELLLLSKEQVIAKVNMLTSRELLS